MFLQTAAPPSPLHTETSQTGGAHWQMPPVTHTHQHTKHHTHQNNNTTPTTHHTPTNTHPHTHTHTHTHTHRERVDLFCLAESWQHGELGPQRTQEEFCSFWLLGHMDC